jgi:hypothetical protein
MVVDGGEEYGIVAVSPRHSVRLASEYMHLVERAPLRDFVVRTVAKKEANNMLLMTGDIVIASGEVRDRFPAARTYPMHFRKTYYPARLHGDPRLEFERQNEAAALIGLPAAIGHSPDEFRACFLPGTPYSRLSPFDVEPDTSKVRHAEALSLVGAAGLFRLLEEAFNRLAALHAGGLVHGDTELHNFIVCSSPLETIPIDFESALKRDDANGELWEKARMRDLDPVLREALLLECRLGRQPGPMSDLAETRVKSLFADPDAIRRAIDRRGTPSAR